MLKPQVLEAVFVAGCVFVGMTASAVKWDRLAAVSQREMNFGYELISAIESYLTLDRDRNVTTTGGDILPPALELFHGIRQWLPTR